MFDYSMETCVYHLADYPKTYSENMKLRAKILKRAARDLEYRAYVKELFYKDPLFAFNVFFFTLDTRKRPFHKQPFCTYPFQDRAILDIIEAIETGRNPLKKYDLPIEKSRDMGVSWLLIGVYTWIWLNPEGGADFLLGSQKFEFVDAKGNPRTLFEKIRFLLYNLPKWLQPKGFKKNDHDNSARIINPETGASITGESNTDTFSTAGRYASAGYDEFAKWKDTDESAWVAGGDASPCRIPVSTAFGAAGKFYDLVTSGRPKIRLHWSLHPEKAAEAYCRWPRSPEEDLTIDAPVRSPWFDNECLRRDAKEIAQELEMDYIGAGGLVFDGPNQMQRIRVMLREPMQVEQAFEVDITKGALKPITTPRDFDGYVVQWGPLRKTASYAIGVDVAEGKENGDYSVVKVIDRERKCDVMSFRSKCNELMVADVAEIVQRWLTKRVEVVVGKEFETWIPWLAVETTGPGLSTFNLLAERGVANLFMMPTFDSVKGQAATSKGWKTTQASRNQLVTGIREWLETASGRCAPVTVKELTTFVRNKVGKPEAKSGAHDDEVMALGIALQCDVLSPPEVRLEPVVLREDGLDARIFELVPEGNGLEERCLADLHSRQDTMGKFEEYHFGY